LRLLRAVRFAAQLGFEIEDKTFAAVKANASKIKTISAERIRDELIKLFAPPSLPLPATERGEEKESARRTPARQDEGGLGRAERVLGVPAAHGLELLRESGLLRHILPELEATLHCEQSPDYHPEGNVFNHLKLMLAKMPVDADPSLPWSILMHDIAKPVTATRDEKTGSIHFYEHERIGADMAEKILERLRFPRKQTEAIVKAVRCHMQFKDAPQMRKSTLRRLLMRPTFPLELELHRLDCLGSHGKLDIYNFLIEQARELEKKPEIHPPLLTGNDLIKLGLKPGPAMGQLLGEIREKQLQDELKTPAEARAWVKRQLKNSAS
jgi:poly(A) polymerase